MNNIVLYVGGFVLPDKNAAAQRVMANAQLIRELGYNVVLLGTSIDRRSKEECFENSPEIFNGFETYNINYPKSIIEWAMHLFSNQDITRLLKHFGYENVTAIIAYNYPSIALKRLLRLCKTKNIKLIADCTEWLPVSINNPIHKIAKTLDTFYRMRFVHKQLNGLIVISTYLYDYYSKTVKYILKLPPLININDKKWKSKQFKVIDELKIIYAGTPGLKKDRVDHVLHALSKIKGKTNKKFKLDIIGFTENKYEIVFGKNNIPINIKNIVKFLGKIDHDKVIQTTKRSDYTIFLRDNTISSKAGFPTKLVESITCGIPVLTNENSNIKDYLTNYKTGFILDTKTENSLSQSLMVAIDQPTESLIKMKKNCYNSRFFDFRRYKNKFSVFLEEIIKKN